MARQQKRSLSPDFDDDAPREKKAKTKKRRPNAEQWEQPQLEGRSVAEALDLMVRKVERFHSGLTRIEIIDKTVPEDAYLDTSAVEGARTDDQLVPFLKSCWPGQDLGVSSKKLGSPHTLVIVASGIRAANLTRTLKPLKGKNDIVAKLFAKHIKLKEAVELCQASKFGFAVGTPQRVLDLIKQEALGLQSLQRLVLDVTRQDEKKRGMLDYKEILLPLLSLLQEVKTAKDGDKNTTTPWLVLF